MRLVLSFFLLLICITFVACVFVGVAWLSVFLLLLLGIAFAAALIFFAKRETSKKNNLSDIELIKIWSKRTRSVCIISILLLVVGAAVQSQGFIRKINEKTFTTDSGIKIDLHEEYDANGDKTYVGKYTNEDGKEIIYSVSEPDKDSAAWEKLIQAEIEALVLIVVLGFGIDILNRIIETGIPFTETVANRLLQIGVILMTSGMIKQTVVAAILITFRLWEKSDLKIIAVDIAPVLAGFFIYLASVIFKYGIRLQRTEDELI